MSKKTSSSVNEDSETKAKNIIYMAHRQVARGKTDLLGPFTNHDAALNCAKDSFYPEEARVVAIDTANALEAYQPKKEISALYPNKKTYYLFMEGAIGVPPNLRNEIEYEIVELDGLVDDCFYQEETELTETLLVAGLVQYITPSYEEMYVVRLKNEAALSALALYFDKARIVRARGGKDRRALLDIRSDIAYIKSHLYAGGDIESFAEEVAQTFWQRFVIDKSPLPELDLYHWETLS